MVFDESLKDGRGQKGAINTLLQAPSSSTGLILEAAGCGDVCWPR
jgi:hypothetical protein